MNAPSSTRKKFFDANSGVHSRADANVFRLPLAMVGASLVAFAALWVSESRFVLLPFLALALVASQVATVRFDAAARSVSIARIVLFSLAVVLMLGRLKAQAGEVSPLFLLPCAGAVAACEIVITAWLQKPWGGARGQSSVFLSGLVLASGGATFEGEALRFLVPLYFGLLVFGLRAFRRIPKPDLHSWRKSFSPTVALLLALAGGAVLHYGVRTHQSELNEWGNRFLENKPLPEPTGLSTSPTLGSGFGQTDSPTRVLTIRNLGDDPHLRVMSFDTYRLGKWFPVQSEREFTRVEPQEFRPRARGRRALVTRLLDDGGLLVAPLDVQGIVVAPDSNLEWSDSDHTPLRSLDSLSFYKLILPETEARGGLSSTRISPEERLKCLSFPQEIDPQIRRMAATLGAQIDDPRERIEAVVSYLRSHHKYSLHAERGAGDPVSSFLLEGRAAHCEYFASAAAILLRCMNVPTRYVIGYYAHESDGGELTTVRLRDAHAWAESWIDGQGWTTVEATPASGIPNQTTKLSTIQKWREKWQDFVMNVRHRLIGFMARLQATSLVLQLFCGLVLLLISALLFWCKRRSSSTRSRFYQAPNAEIAVLMARFEKRMKRRGVVCSGGQTWREQLERLGERERMKALQFLDCYQSARFGLAKNRAALDEARRLLKTLEMWH